jgi:hypothetical protein
MSDGTYTAKLIDGESTESIELELIAGEPQKSFVRSGTVDGDTVDVVWELDTDADQPTYRVADGSGYGEAGTS